MMCQRLKEVLPKIINLNQWALVSGMSIFHNVLLSQEFLKGYERVNISPCCIMKIDLKKAYDSFSLDFLLELMDALNLPSIFLN